MINAKEANRGTWEYGVEAKIKAAMEIGYYEVRLYDPLDPYEKLVLKEAGYLIYFNEVYGYTSVMWSSYEE